MIPRPSIGTAALPGAKANWRKWWSCRA